MRRIRLLLLISLAVLAALPASASAKAPGLAKVVGVGIVDFSSRGRAQLFGELDHGRVLYSGRGRPRVVSCADRRPLKRCAIRRTFRGVTEWVVYKPARIFVLARDYRLRIEDGGAMEISITGTGSLAVDGQGELTEPRTGTRQYAGADAVELEPTRRRTPRRLP
jgi:hypothetical protein